MQELIEKLFSWRNNKRLYLFFHAVLFHSPDFYTLKNQRSPEKYQRPPSTKQSYKLTSTTQVPGVYADVVWLPVVLPERVKPGYCDLLFYFPLEPRTILNQNNKNVLIVYSNINERVRKCIFISRTGCNKEERTSDSRSKPSTQKISRAPISGLLLKTRNPLPASPCVFFPLNNLSFTAFHILSNQLPHEHSPLPDKPIPALL